MPHACVRVLALLRATAARKGHRRRRVNAGLERALTRNRRYLTFIPPRLHALCRRQAKKRKRVGIEVLLNLLFSSL